MCENEDYMNETQTAVFGEEVQTIGELSDESEMFLTQRTLIFDNPSDELMAPSFKPTYSSGDNHSFSQLRQCDFLLRRYSANNRFFELSREDPDSTCANVVFRLIEETLRAIEPSDWHGMRCTVQRAEEEEVDLEELAALAREKTHTFLRSLSVLERRFVKAGISGCDDYVVVERESEQGYLLLQAVLPLNELAGCLLRIRGQEVFAPLKVKDSLCRDLETYYAQKNSASHCTKRMGDSLVSDW